MPKVKPKSQLQLLKEEMEEKQQKPIVLSIINKINTDLQKKEDDQYNDIILYNKLNTIMEALNYNLKKDLEKYGFSIFDGHLDSKCPTIYKSVHTLYIGDTLTHFTIPKLRCVLFEYNGIHLTDKNMSIRQIKTVIDAFDKKNIIKTCSVFNDTPRCFFNNVTTFEHLYNIITIHNNALKTEKYIYSKIIFTINILRLFESNMNLLSSNINDIIKLYKKLY